MARIEKRHRNMDKRRRLTLSEIIERMPSPNRLTPLQIRYQTEPYKSTQIFCRCVCGKEMWIGRSNLFKKNYTSCGCYAKELLSKRVRKYHPHIRRLYNVWKNMLDRCYNPNSVFYKYYGGNGVLVCDEWRSDYQVFLDWAIANGWEKGLKIDKDIKAQKMGIKADLYSPARCQFVTQKENNNARKGVIKHDYMGEMLTLGDILIKSNICMSYETIRKRIKRGMNLLDALNLPLKTRQKPLTPITSTPTTQI